MSLWFYRSGRQPNKFSFIEAIVSPVNWYSETEAQCVVVKIIKNINILNIGRRNIFVGGIHAFDLKNSYPIKEPIEILKDIL